MARHDTIKLLDNQIYKKGLDGEMPVFELRYDHDAKIDLSGHKYWKSLGTWRAIQGRVSEASEKSVVVIGDEEGYEHNTRDDFVSVDGWSDEHFTVVTGNLIGYVKHENTSLTIGSRFGNAFLEYIIRDADGFSMVHDIGGAGDEYGAYDWLLAYLWKIKLTHAFRIGIPKCYQTKRDRLIGPKGRIDVCDALTYPGTGRCACEYRELSYDSPAAELIAQSWVFMYRNPKLRAMCASVSRIKDAFLQATGGGHRKIRELLDTKYFTNPYYGVYNDVIDLSKKVLRHYGANFGEDTDMDALLFDVSMLFEYFVRKLLLRHGIPLKGKNAELYRIPTGALQETSKYSRRKIIPDLVIDVPGGVAVFDVKYKYYDERYGVSRDDVFQVHTYVGQYANKSSVRACGLIYPLKEYRWKSLFAGEGKGRVLIKQEMQQGGVDIAFYVAFIVVPEDDKDFAEKFKAHCSEFIRQFSDELLKDGNTKNNRGDL